MLRQSVLWIGFVLLAGSGPCLAEPASRPAGNPSTPQGALTQLDRPSTIEIDVLRTAGTQLRAAPPTRALLAEIAAWLSANFALPATNDLPRIAFVAPAKLTALRYGTPLTSRSSHVEIAPDRMAPPNRDHNVLALYHDATRTVYLQNGWTGATPAELSVLVHEMVHHLQSLAGLKYACAEARERPAYAAQQRWLEKFGRSLDGEFSIDPMTLLARTTCAM